MYVDELQELTEGGSTALGPALTFALGMASQIPRFFLILSNMTKVH
jgi:hypothetical protein